MPSPVFYHLLTAFPLSLSDVLRGVAALPEALCAALLGDALAVRLRAVEPGAAGGRLPLQQPGVQFNRHLGTASTGILSHALTHSQKTRP